MRAESAVEPTRSENITVTWRRSARSSGGALGALDAVAASRRAPCRSHRGAEQQWHRAACGGAQRRRRQAPSGPQPSGSGRTVSSISFSRNAASYFPRPRLRSQTTMSMMRPRLLLAPYHPANGTERAYSGVGVGKRAAGAAGAQAVVGAKGGYEHSELLINAAGLKVSLQLPPCMKVFYVCHRGPNGSSSLITRPVRPFSPHIRSV